MPYTTRSARPKHADPLSACFAQAHADVYLSYPPPGSKIASWKRYSTDTLDWEVR